MSSGAQRAVALILLLVAGVGSLPVVAFLFDDQGTENWIFPVQVLVMALLGAAVGRALPALAGRGASSTRATIMGALTGVVMAVVGLLVFFLLLSGIDGA